MYIYLPVYRHDVYFPKKAAYDVTSSPAHMGLTDTIATEAHPNSDDEGPQRYHNNGGTSEPLCQPRHQPHGSAAGAWSMLRMSESNPFVGVEGVSSNLSLMMTIGTYVKDK